ncbi:YoaK family protein [Gordonia sp. NPDC003376]
MYLTVMMILTFVTGMVDAAGYLGLDKVFVGNMTGNVVILGMGASGTDGLPVLGPTVALGTFVAAAYVTRTFLRDQPAGWTRRNSWCLAANTVIFAGCAIAALTVHHTSAQIVEAAASAFAMGNQAYLARRANVKDMTTVVVTSTLVMLAGESTSLRDRRLAAVLAMALGAVAGALVLTHVHLAGVFLVAGLLTVGAAILAHRRHVTDVGDRRRASETVLT